MVLAHVIELSNSAQHLDLEDCYMECEGLQRLIPILHRCQELRLSRNNLGDSGVKLLSVALRNPDCKIQELHLCEVGLSDSCVEDLASALGKNQSLTDLYLDSNTFTDQSSATLSSLIRSCKSLMVIELRWNEFSPDVKRLLKSLQAFRVGLIVTV
ncbi:NACHT, LRR and PYD domains-containing protein 3-like [Scyliorhinus canicula]|uniref:NACHT, LRR and PYD domains-containing protein 3-like n=1 Tax=Scyliorhinus canicula TaxID=7830 RepID=UPI0018F4AD25|nr:NACHT, LRR and PYD domains-containing protein 3-like [Scyliorhinus canicula]